jgi:FkbM family methyltransferase
MINYIKRKLQKLRQKKTFLEYGYELKTFDIDSIGKVEYAQWLHPFETPKAITSSNINFYKMLASPGSMIIDIGAHTGDTTVPMALAIGNEGLVLALEPNRYVYKILQKNATLNPGFGNIVPVCFASTKEDGEFVFNYSDASFNNGGFLEAINTRNHHHDYTLKVTGKNLEKYLLQNYTRELEKLALIKIDAEGYDKEILKTLPGILKQYKPNLIIECYKRLNEQERYELFDVVDGFGYNLYRLENFEESGGRELLRKKNMTDYKHFEMLAIHKDK